MHPDLADGVGHERQPLNGCGPRTANDKAVRGPLALAVTGAAPWPTPRSISVTIRTDWEDDVPSVVTFDAPEHWGSTPEAVHETVNHLLCVGEWFPPWPRSASGVSAVPLHGLRDGGRDEGAVLALAPVRVAVGALGGCIAHHARG